MCVKLSQLCPVSSLRLYGQLPTRLPVHGDSPGKNTGWVVISSSKDLPDPGVKLASLTPPALAGGFSTTEPLGSPVSGLFPSKAKETLSPLHMTLQAVNS